MRANEEEPGALSRQLCVALASGDGEQVQDNLLRICSLPSDDLHASMHLLAEFIILAIDDLNAATGPRRDDKAWIKRFAPRKADNRVLTGITQMMACLREGDQGLARLTVHKMLASGRDAADGSGMLLDLVGWMGHIAVEARSAARGRHRRP